MRDAIQLGQEINANRTKKRPKQDSVLIKCSQAHFEHRRNQAPLVPRRRWLKGAPVSEPAQTRNGGAGLGFTFRTDGF